ncbi:hypothetical protein, partial [Kitasatospora sp. NPDC059673]|uniref:hypothetical protein n=1 Tax=Kitasatospora sp. NPDC059673 TaxID=3346901 RepID=UPI0036B86435
MSTTSASSLRAVLTPTAIMRLAVGWGGYLVVTLLAPVLAEGLPTLVLWTVLAAIVGIIVVCAFGV